MISLNKTEFSNFNLRSKLRLLKKDGELITKSSHLPNFTFECYKIYDFYVELIYDKLKETTIQITPWVSKDLYRA